MTIDTKELRRLAQAATPHVGHACNYQDAHSPREGHVDFENADLFIASERPQEDAAFYAAANPATVIELLDRLEAAENDVALKERVIDALGSELNAVANERDELRALVVMRFDHDHPPQFVQGYDPHELNEPVTAEHCRWFVAEIGRLRAKIAEMEKQEPVAHVWRCDNGHIHGSSERFLPMGTKLYLAPGAKGEEK